MYEGQRAQSPFDDSAVGRLLRMGLTNENGTPDLEAIAVCACMFAGQFFDDLCDFFEDYAEVQRLIDALSTEADVVGRNQKFLLVCSQYDAVFCPLPAPIWWLRGNPGIAERFADGFLAHLQRLNQNI